MNTKNEKKGFLEIAGVQTVRIPGNRRRTDCDCFSDLYHSGTSGGLHCTFMYQSFRSLERNDCNP